MGRNIWRSIDAAQYSVYASTAATKSVSETFTSRSIHQNLDPRTIVMRESRDSEANPQSTPIIIALDVTGSMGNIAHQMAKSGLGTLITGILDHKPVTDPHIMFMAVGDITNDRAPLQVSQFEADYQIVEQLSQIYVEGGGGGNNFESYNLPWLFAGRRTSVDCVKRGKKGYLFTIGDELPAPDFNNADLRAVGLDYLCDDSQGTTTSAAGALADAQQTYHVFHLIVEEGSYARRHQGVVDQWREVLGNRALPLSDYTKLSEVILAAIAVSEGMDPEDAISQWQDDTTQKVIRHAFGL